MAMLVRAAPAKIVLANTLKSVGRSDVAVYDHWSPLSTPIELFFVSADTDYLPNRYADISAITEFWSQGRAKLRVFPR